MTQVIVTSCYWHSNAVTGQSFSSVAPLEPSILESQRSTGRHPSVCSCPPGPSVDLLCSVFNDHTKASNPPPCHCRLASHPCAPIPAGNHKLLPSHPPLCLDLANKREQNCSSLSFPHHHPCFCPLFFSPFPSKPQPFSYFSLPSPS